MLTLKAYLSRVPHDKKIRDRIYLFVSNTFDACDYRRLFFFLIVDKKITHEYSLFPPIIEVAQFPVGERVPDHFLC